MAVDKADKIAFARNNLALAREFKSLGFINLVEGLIKESGFSHTDIHTSPEELKKLKRDFSLLIAKQALENLRRSPNLASLHDLRCHLGLSEASPEDIGTTEGEIKKLAAAYYLGEAQKYLVSLRRKPSFEELYLFEGNLDMAKAALEDVGATVEEVESLRRQCHLASAKGMIEQARKSNNRHFARLAKYHLERAGAACGEIGASAAELAEPN